MKFQNKFTRNYLTENYGSAKHEQNALKTKLLMSELNTKNALNSVMVVVKDMKSSAWLFRDEVAL